MLSVRTIATGAGIEVQDVRCGAARGGRSREERVDAFEVVLPRRGVFVRHIEGRDLVADANHALLLRPGEPYCVSHPVAGGDDCTVFRLGASWSAALADGGPPTARRDQVLTPARVELLHRILLARAREGCAPLALQEIVAEILGLLLEPRGPEDPRQRPQTRALHSAAVRRACAELAAGRGDKLQLGELARRVGLSPFHLSRIFRAHTGTTLHRYHERLRLRAALQRILEGERDLTRVALEAGFAHHSHFTTRFRREFGVPPSACRGRRALALVRRGARRPGS